MQGGFFSSKFMVHGSKFMVHGSWFLVHGFWFLVSGFWLRPETHRAPCHPHVDKRKTKRFQHCCLYQKQNQMVHPDAMNYEPRTMNHEP
jgi:hypothetical protein